MGHDKANKQDLKHVEPKAAAENKQDKGNNDHAKDGKKDKGDKILKSREEKKVFKLEWTLERCKRYARRFPSEAHWASGSPASYKSAVAHGWLRDCLAEMQDNQTHDNVRPLRKAA